MPLLSAWADSSDQGPCVHAQGLLLFLDLYILLSYGKEKLYMRSNIFTIKAPSGTLAECLNTPGPADVLVDRGSIREAVKFRKASGTSIVRLGQLSFELRTDLVRNGAPKDDTCLIVFGWLSRSGSDYGKTVIYFREGSSEGTAIYRITRNTGRLNELETFLCGLPNSVS